MPLGEPTFDKPKTNLPETGEKEDLLETVEPEGISRREFLRRGIMGTAWLAALTGIEACKSIAVREIELAKEPTRVLLDIYYTSHRVPEDLDNMRDNLERSDVYLMEGMSHTDKSRAIMQDVAEGKKTASEVIQGNPYWSLNPAHEFLSKELELIYGSKKPVIYLDVPSNHPLEDSWWRERKREFDLRHEEKDFRKEVQITKEIFKNYALIQQEREDYMKQKLEALASGLKTKDFSAWPDLTRKQKERLYKLHNRGNVRLLFVIGAAHTSLYHTFKKAERMRKGNKYSLLDDTTREFETKTRPYVYGHRAEVLRRYIFGKEVSDELMAQTILATEIDAPLRRALEGFTAETNKITRFVRRAVSFFKTENILDVVARLRATPYKNRLALLEEMGVVVPKNEQELDAALR